MSNSLLESMPQADGHEFLFMIMPNVDA